MKQVKEVHQRFDKLVSLLSSNGVLKHPNLLLNRAAELWPDRTALVCENNSITFRELAHRAAYLAEILVRDKSIMPDDRVLVLYENSIDFFIAYHAAWMTGAIVAPLNIFLSEKELEHIIADAQPKLIITSPTLCKKVAEQTRVPVICDDLMMITADAIKQNTHFTPQSPAISACTLLLYTSGTTGLPKGVMHSGESIMTNCLQAIANFEITSQERLFAALPLFHSYMQNVSVWCALVVGAMVIIIPRITRTALLRGLKHRPTIIPGIPQLFGLFCMMKKISFPNTQLFVSGGDALNPVIKLGFELLFNRRIINGYGLTETAPLIAVNIEDTHAPTHCVGRPFLGIDVAVRINGKDVPTETIGTIWVRGKNVMLGYYNAPQATADVMKDGWFNTGDLGYIDQSGRIILSGREKDLIVNKGIKIYPQEVEEILAKHPNVQLAAVVGLQRDGTEVPIAFIVPHKMTTGLEKELRHHCQELLAPYKVPQQFYLRDKLPQTATGKIDKKTLRSDITHEILE